MSRSGGVTNRHNHFSRHYGRRHTQLYGASPAYAPPQSVTMTHPVRPVGKQKIPDHKAELNRCVSCGKLAFPSVEEADAAIVRIQSRHNDEGLHSYFCPYSCSYHIGH